MSRTLRFAFTIASLGILAVAGCGDGGSSETETDSAVQESLQRAAETTGSATTVSLTEEVTTDGMTTSSKGSAVVGDTLQAEILTEDDSGVWVTVRMIGTIFYTELTDDQQASVGGKRWMRMDLGTEGSTEEELAEQYDNLQPAHGLNLMLDSGETITEVGDEQIDDLATVHYSTTMSVDSYLERLGAEQAASEGQTLAEKGVTEVRVEVWIDETDHLVRCSVVQGDDTTVITYTNYDEPVTVEAPEDSDVVDYDDVVGA